MKLRLVPAVAVLLAALMVLVIGHRPAAASVRSQAANLFESGQFAKLEALHKRYLGSGSESRASDGLWKLDFFYNGLDSVLGAQNTAPIYWQMKERAIKRWLKAYPDSPAAHLMYAMMHIAHAWQIRGPGYASTVKPEHWQPFRDYLERAREYLLEHKDVASTDPEWYCLMTRIAKAEGWKGPDFVALVEDGVRRFPGYYPLYFDAVHALLPKWGGSPDAVEAFARYAVTKTKAAEGYALYTRIYWYAADMQFRDHLFDQSRVDWPTMKQGIDDVLKRYPDNWNTNNFAYFACLAKDRAKTAELMARIEIPLIRDVWHSGQRYRACKALAQGS